jgi:hypothetical protein
MEIGTATLGISVARKLRRKEEHDDRDQNDRHDQRQFGIVQRGADRGAAIDGDGHVHVGRHGRFQMRQLLLHVVDGLDDVGVRLAEQDDQDRRLSVGHAEIAHILNGVLHLGDVGQLHRRAVAVGDDQRRVIRGHTRLVVGVDLIAAVAVVDGALRTVGVGRGERRAHVFEADAVFVKRLRVELDAHCRKRRPADHNVADAAELRQPLRQDVARGVVHLALRHRLGGQRQNEDRRIGRIDLAVGRIAGKVGGEIGSGGVDGGLDVACGAVDVAGDVELQRDARLPDPALRGHFGHVGDLAEVAFERLGDAG